MKNTLNASTSLALITILVAVLSIFAWIPMDVGSGMFEKVRSRVVIGDAFAPTFAASLLALGGILLLFEARKATNHPKKTLGLTHSLSPVFDPATDSHSRHASKTFPATRSRGIAASDRCC